MQAYFSVHIKKKIVKCALAGKILPINVINTILQLWHKKDDQKLSKIKSIE